MTRREWKKLVERALVEQIPHAWDKYWELEHVHDHPTAAVLDTHVIAAIQMHGQALDGTWLMQETEEVWDWLRRANVVYTPAQPSRA